MRSLPKAIARLRLTAFAVRTDSRRPASPSHVLFAFLSLWIITRLQHKKRPELASLAPVVVAAWATAGCSLTAGLLLNAPTNACVDYFLDTHRYVVPTLVMTGALGGATLGTLPPTQKMFRLASPLVLGVAAAVSYAAGLQLFRAK